MQKAFPIFAMELFCDGWLFLEHSDVTWDGSSHALKRVRINADKSEWLLSRAREHFTDVPSNIDLCQYVGTTLEELEKHTELVVPRDDVSPRLQLLFEGDLTPITLVQLMCVGDWLSVRQTSEDTICVAYDERLAQQISGFGFLMRRFRAVLCSQSAMLSSSVVATVLEARPATEPGICAFLEMDDPLPVEPEAGAVVEPQVEPGPEVEPVPESEPEPEPESEPEAASGPEDSSEPEPEPEPAQTPEPASEAAPDPSAKEQEKMRIAREVKTARDKMEELDKSRETLLTQLLVLRREYQKLSGERNWEAFTRIEEIGKQIKEMSGQIDQLDKQLSDARLAYAETRAASLQALKELGQ
ncbi:MULTISPECIES: hypothetical protein [unclassified Collinsella]|uniref:hypothetical protein n=1 Tax=unclassified Collinsella TaxID=2637548 RepID=UPI0012B2B01E|nr:MULTISPECIES: hypothetical protein [unclassified Collinsella]MSS25315.1 hypothetical protein [Collinsella sp. WCA1-178-WT-3 (M2)]MSS51701.1 hypothetical protein [Collinsella sp. WCA1-178-WT-3 (M1)]